MSQTFWVETGNDPAYVRPMRWGNQYVYTNALQNAASFSLDQHVIW